MPQMSPLPWTIILFITLILYFTIMTMIYFNNKPIMTKSNKIHNNMFLIKW